MTPIIEEFLVAKYAVTSAASTNSSLPRITLIEKLTL